MAIKKSGKFTGVLVPTLTPFREDLSPDSHRLIQLCQWQLARGVDGLAVFGTTSEGNSLSVGERNALIDRLIEAGIPANRLMPGTGACALPDAIELTRHAVSRGAGGVLVLPPFYYKNQTDDGFYAYFSEIIQRVGDRNFSLYLYHFPQLSAAPISLALIARLLKTYPETLAGVKDSSGNWEGTKAMIAEFPELAIFPSSESRLFEGLGLGAAGCISASANIQPAAIRKLIDVHASTEARQWHDRIAAVRAIIEQYPAIPALKSILAHQTGDKAWATLRPPLTPLPTERQVELVRSLNSLVDFDPIRLEQSVRSSRESVTAG